MKIMMQGGKIRFERKKNSLDELEINALEIKINAEIEILKYNRLFKIIKA